MNSQAPIKVYHPPGTLDLVLDSNLMAGTYYIKVEGSGNEFAPDYASLGSYSMQTNFHWPLHCHYTASNCRDRSTAIVMADMNPMLTK